MSVSSTIKKTQITAHDAQCHSWHISSENTPASQRIEATPVGFEPTRGDPIGLAGRRLNHSAKVSFAIEIDLPQNCMHDKLDARRPHDQRIARAGARPPRAAWAPATSRAVPVQLRDRPTPPPGTSGHTGRAAEGPLFRVQPPHGNRHPHDYYN